MRIGLFSDTYLPAINGISYVLKIMQRQLTDMGHEVYIIAPATNLRGKEPNDEDHVIRFPAIEGFFFDDYLLSVFFPPVAYKKISQLDLDVIHYFTPSQIGLLGMYAAIKNDIPLIGQYSTDLYRYVEKYPAVLPGTVALSMVAPIALKLTPREVARVMLALKPRMSITDWHKNMVARMHRVIHDKCDSVIALSPKMKKLLDSWGCERETVLLPTGVDPLPKPNRTEVEEFRNQYGIAKNDVVMLYAGRPSREKNVDLLIRMFEEVGKDHENVWLVIAGGGSSDIDGLKALAEKSKYSERIIFTGRYERSHAGVIYGAADIFVFPSVTDTQGLVVNEAACASLPLVMCDNEVSEVFIDGETGLLAKNNSKDYAKTVSKLINDSKLRHKMGKQAKKTALLFTESGQMKKMEKIYQDCIDNHHLIRW